MARLRTRRNGQGKLKFGLLSLPVFGHRGAIRVSYRGAAGRGRPKRLKKRRATRPLPRGEEEKNQDREL